MKRYAQLVTGPAGSGKSTYCSAMVQHGAAIDRTIEVVNLDPGCENFSYEPLADVRELINVNDTMEDEELRFGPNGGLVYCIEYLLENSDWLKAKLGDEEDSYILFDCPGQIELYTHLTIMKRLANLLQKEWGFRVSSVFLVDVSFMVDGAKFLSGTMTALSIMVNLHLPHVNLLSKMDSIGTSDRDELEGFLDPDLQFLLDDKNDGTSTSKCAFNKKYRAFTEAIGSLIENFSMVRFYPLDLNDPDNISENLTTIDSFLMFDELSK